MSWLKKIKDWHEDRQIRIYKRLYPKIPPIYHGEYYNKVMAGRRLQRQIRGIIKAHIENQVKL